MPSKVLPPHLVLWACLVVGFGFEQETEVPAAVLCSWSTVFLPLLVGLLEFWGLVIVLSIANSAKLGNRLQLYSCLLAAVLPCFISVYVFCLGVA